MIMWKCENTLPAEALVKVGANVRMCLSPQTRRLKRLTTDH